MRNRGHIRCFPDSLKSRRWCFEAFRSEIYSFGSSFARLLNECQIIGLCESKTLGWMSVKYTLRHYAHLREVSIKILGPIHLAIRPLYA